MEARSYPMFFSRFLHTAFQLSSHPPVFPSDSGPSRLDLGEGRLLLPECLSKLYVNKTKSRPSLELQPVMKVVGGPKSPTKQHSVETRPDLELRRESSEVLRTVFVSFGLSLVFCFSFSARWTFGSRCLRIIRQRDTCVCETDACTRYTETLSKYCSMYVSQIITPRLFVCVLTLLTHVRLLEVLVFKTTDIAPILEEVVWELIFPP